MIWLGDGALSKSCYKKIVISPPKFLISSMSVSTVGIYSFMHFLLINDSFIYIVVLKKLKTMELCCVLKLFS